MEDQTRSLSEVAGLMGVSERTVRRWIKSGRLKAYKPGRDYRIPESGLRAFIEESEISPKVQAPPPEPSLFNGIEEEERRPRVFDIVHELVNRQLEEDQQAIARAHESGRPQGSSVRHENEAFKRLLNYPPGDVAEAYVDLMRDIVLLERELERLESRRSSTAGTAHDDVYLKAIQKAVEEMASHGKLDRTRTE